MTQNEQKASKLATEAAKVAYRIAYKEAKKDGMTDEESDVVGNFASMAEHDEVFNDYMQSVWKDGKK